MRSGALLPSSHDGVLEADAAATALPTSSSGNAGLGEGSNATKSVHCGRVCSGQAV